MTKPNVDRGNVYRHGNKWYGKFKVKGRSIRTRLHPNESAARVALRELRAKLAATS